MISLDFDWQTNEFMLYCRTTQLREKSMMEYEQSLKLFGRWCMDEMGIFTVDKVTENVIRHYIMELQERGKYTFYIVDKQKKTNYPERRRDYRKPIRVIIHKSSHLFADTVKGWIFCCPKYCGKAGHTGRPHTGRCQKQKTSPAMCPGHTVGEVLFIRVPLHRQPEAGGAARQHPYGILRQRFRSIRHLRCWQEHRR